MIQFEAREDLAIGSELGRVTAEGSGPIRYTILGDDDGHFSIEADSGIIRLERGLDYENASSYALTVEARNAAGASTAKVQIDVIDVPPAAPLTGQVIGAAENSPVGASAGQVEMPAGASPTGFAIASGNIGSKWGITDTGMITVQGALSYEERPSYTLGITATDAEGTSPPVPVEVNIVKPPFTYAPIADGAWSYWRPAIASSIVAESGSVEQMLDLGPRGLSWVPDADTDTYPLPVLQEGEAGLNGLAVLRANGQSRLSGNELMMQLSQAASFLAVEAVIEIEAVTSSSDIVGLSRNQDRSARFNLAVTRSRGIPQIRLVTRRRDRDVARTHFSSVRIFPQTPLYVYAAVDWLTGRTVLQVNSTRETQIGPWTSGVGMTEDTPSKWSTLGYGGNAQSRLRLAELATYRSEPTDELLISNRVALAARYGIT